MKTRTNLLNCARFGCKTQFLLWDAVEYHFCGELHRTCSYTCLHHVKQAVTCRVHQKHKDEISKILNPEYKDLSKVWGKL